MKVQTVAQEQTERQRSKLIIHAESLLVDSVEVPASAFNYDGFRAWALSNEFPEHGRITFLSGDVQVDLTLEELETHNQAKGEVTSILANINHDEEVGRVFSSGARIASPQGELSCEPDAVYCSWQAFETGCVKLVPLSSDPKQLVLIEGTPDLVVEVVSDSSAIIDKRVLPTKYHRAGIPEYWLIDARKKLDFRILVWAPSRYQPASEEGGWQKSQVMQRQFKLMRTKGRMGYWKYHLQTRP